MKKSRLKKFICAVLTVVSISFGIIGVQEILLICQKAQKTVLMK